VAVVVEPGAAVRRSFPMALLQRVNNL